MPEQIDVDKLSKEEGVKVPGAAYDVERDREGARKNLAYGMLALLAVTSLVILGGVLAAFLTVGEAKDLAAAVLAPLVVLVGTVFGFYYSGQDRKGP